MADCIVERITANIATAMATVNSYPAAVAAVERERMLLNIQGRYPFIEIGGPYCEAETQTYKVEMTDLYYVIKYYIKKNDESTTANTELPYLTRNVCADMAKVLWVDPSRGALAQFTHITDQGYDFDLDDSGEIEFYRYIVAQVRTRIHAADPYNLG
jgi:hypothetical protein